MKNKITQPLILLKTTVSNIQQNPIILYPTLVLALVQFLVLEVLYFAPRYPLSNFFSPLISKVWSEEFLHYPMDLVLLPKLFYYAQIIIYLFGGTFLLAMTAYIVADLNNHARIHLRTAFNEANRQYIHILCSSVISLILFQMLSSAYSAFVTSALKIKTTNETTILFQKFFLASTPYIQFLIGILVTTLLIYVVPVIVIERKKILSAIKVNLEVLLRSFRTSFLVVLIPTLFYLPVLVVRNNIESFANWWVPDVQLFVIGLGVVVTMAIDLIILTTITTHYLFLKENA